MQFLVLILVLFFPAGFFISQSRATEIHEEKYFCGGENRVDSNSRILILSPSKTYLSFEVLQNLTGKGIFLKKFYLRVQCCQLFQFCRF